LIACIWAKKQAFEILPFCTSQTSVTLTLDLVTRHAVVYQSLISIYTPNFVQICGRMDRYMDGQWGRVYQVDSEGIDLKINKHIKVHRPDKLSSEFFRISDKCYVCDDTKISADYCDTNYYCNDCHATFHHKPNMGEALWAVLW